MGIGYWVFGDEGVGGDGGDVVLCETRSALAQPLSTTRSANVENDYAHQPGVGRVGGDEGKTRRLSPVPNPQSPVPKNV
ncbi:hypothetical protein [Anabaena azotica]|uniref:Uncharacterized protein n=1 Tax=Anabaena azotica FACHB-119 TaxID=947527 RepID=A0ABR8D9A0_9NOST|nr:hypothetical protein [Anabaena azotica]MBD2502865.1 hypothetical protein [Anabaena azotica FACHB-119]